MLTEHEEFELAKIYKNSGAELFYDNTKFIIKDVIKELYATNKYDIYRLRLHHLDRAINKYKQAMFRTKIINTKQYFKMCILSAISEYGLEEIDPDNISDFI